MHTGGGEEAAGLVIYDTIHGCSCPVRIEVVGHAWSMGAIILQSAELRVMYPNSSVMIHVGDKEYEGHSDNVRRQVMYDKQVDERCDMILLERMQAQQPDLSLGQLRDTMILDTYYWPEEAIRLGLADIVAGV
jgi:ATP-dependent protease ClpP protease subunit